MKKYLSGAKRKKATRPSNALVTNKTKLGSSNIDHSPHQRKRKFFFLQGGAWLKKFENHCIKSMSKPILARSLNNTVMPKRNGLISNILQMLQTNDFIFITTELTVIAPVTQVHICLNVFLISYTLAKLYLFLINNQYTSFI